MVFYFRDNILLEINTPLNCQHAVLDTVNAIQENIDHNVFSCGIFLDFKKAFETVGMLLIPGTGNGERRTENRERGTGNGEWGTGNGEPGTGNWERESGNKCTAATLLRVQNGGQDKRKGSKRNNLG